MGCRGRSTDNDRTLPPVNTPPVDNEPEFDGFVGSLSPESGLTLEWGANGNVYAIPAGSEAPIGPNDDANKFITMNATSNIVFADGDSRKLPAYMDPPCLAWC